MSQTFEKYGVVASRGWGDPEVLYAVKTVRSAKGVSGGVAVTVLLNDFIEALAAEASVEAPILKAAAKKIMLKAQAKAVPVVANLIPAGE